MANAIVDEETGHALEYRDLIKDPKYRDDWKHSSSNELGQFAQGLKRGINRTGTILFVRHDEIPEDRKRDATYGRIVYDYRPQKEETNRTQLTVGGNRINYPHDVSTPTVDTTTAKCVINSTISTPDAKFMCLDAKNFYLGTPMD
eukprot:2318239-Ditylum_brightwellii.AAC.1